VTRHLSRHGLDLRGLTCFDCESMPLAAALAQAFSLPYPSPAAILACRDKALAKQLWQAAGIPCAAGGAAQSTGDAERLFARLGGPVVLKPRTGSGGAYVTSAATAPDCAAALLDLQRRLARDDDRLYAFPGQQGDDRFDPRRSLLIEARLNGPEYSCDFIVEGARATVLRTSRKIAGGPLGRIAAYVTPAGVPGLGQDRLATRLRDAAHALGVQRGLCTADFILVDAEAVLLELAPRPGGDCLPRLVRHALGRDTLCDAVSFAEGRSLDAPAMPHGTPLVGLMLRAEAPGTIVRIDTTVLQADERTIDCVETRRAGDRLSMDEVVGELVFRPRSPETIDPECREMRDRLVLQIAALP
jgi:biotin carboxylase